MSDKETKDQIALCGVRLLPRLGTGAEERGAAQECRADLTVWGNFEAAAATDSLESSVDYCRILQTMRETAAEGEYVLVETLAYRIVRRVLRTYPVTRVRIRLRKSPAVLSGQLDFVEVTVEEP